MAFYCTAKTVRGGQIKPSGLYSLHILDSKNTFGISGPLGEKMGVRLLYSIPDFEGHFDQYFTHNSKTILDMKLIFFHFVGIFIFYKMKKKFNSITFFFMEIYSVFFIENGKF